MSIEPTTLCDGCHRRRTAEQLARCPADSACCQAVAERHRRERARLPVAQREGHATVAWPGN